MKLVKCQCLASYLDRFAVNHEFISNLKLTMSLFDSTMANIMRLLMALSKHLASSLKTMRKQFHRDRNPSS